VQEVRQRPDRLPLYDPTLHQKPESGLQLGDGVVSVYRVPLIPAQNGGTIH
jgi:hypothetical protein